MKIKIIFKTPSTPPIPCVRPCIILRAGSGLNLDFALFDKNIFSCYPVLHRRRVVPIKLLQRITLAQQNKVGRTATSVTRANGVLVVRYHATDVVSYNENTKEVTLRTGGYDTVTTRLRMNQAARQFGLGFGVGRDKGITYLHLGGKKQPLVDGMTFKVVDDAQ